MAKKVTATATKPATFNVTEEATIATLKQAGLDDAQIAKAMAGLRSARVTATVEVLVNPANERQYGDASIFKVQESGYRKPAMGVRKGQIPALIKGLQVAQALLDAEEAASQAG